MNSLICSAIDTKRTLQVYYNGGHRTVEPFCYGVTKNGIELLRAYQVRGHSESGNPSGWKLFRVEKMVDLKVTDEPFTGKRPGYNPDDPAMVTLYCHV